VKPFIIPFFLRMEGCLRRCAYCRQEIAQEEIITEASQISQLLKISLACRPMGRPCEAAFFGGSFTALPPERRQELYESVQPFLTDGSIDYIRVSTRPDMIDRDIALELFENGIRVVELGVQSLNEDVLELVQRGHDTECPFTATRILKEAGIQVGWQLMQGLPGSSVTEDLKSLRSSLEAHPDFLRLFPCVVLDKTPLADMWRNGKYQPLELEAAVDLLASMLDTCDSAAVPVIRVGLHPSPALRPEVLAGPFHPAFRHLVESRRRLRILEALFKNEEFSEKSISLEIKTGTQSLWRGMANSNTLELMKRFKISELHFIESEKPGIMEASLRKD